MIYIFITLIAFGLLFYLGRGLKEKTQDKKWIILVTSVPVLAVGLYFALGDPDYRDQPYAEVTARKDALMQESSENLIAAFRKKLKENDDAKARHFLGETLARMGRFNEAAIEFKKAYNLSKGTDNNIAVSYGEILVAMNNRTVNDDALAVFEEVLKSDAQDPRALFYSGLYYFQNDKGNKGAVLWKDLLDAAKGQPWQARVLNNIAKSSDIHKIDLEKYGITLPAPQAGFTPDQIDMIEGMVESLRQKVKDNPDDMALKKRLEDVEEKFKDIKKGRQKEQESK